MRPVERFKDQHSGLIKSYKAITIATGKSAMLS